VAQCTPLQRLDLDGTPITSATLGKLAHLEELQFLRLHGTSLDDGALSHLAQFKNLKKLYVWNTGIKQSALREFKEKNAGIEIEDGIQDSLESFFRKSDTLGLKQNGAP